MERRRRLLRRGAPALAVLALLALLVGFLIGGGSDGAKRETAQSFAAHWARGDYEAMYELLDEPSRRDLTLDELKDAYETAAATATTRGLTVGEAADPTEAGVAVPVTVRTRVFGTVAGTIQLRLSGEDDAIAVVWSPSLVFPGLRAGEQLTRETQMPERAALLARDGAVLAEGPDRTSEIADVAAHVVGRVEPIPPEDVQGMRALGYPEDASVGVSGLERVFQQQLAGLPGGTLLAGGRVLASSRPRASPAVTTTISPEVERAAVAQMGSRYGGISAIDPKTGEVLALAGVAYSGLQPPGSTFKIITLVGALEQGITRPDERFEVVSEALLSGVPIQNANGEYCGGTLVESFAHSCNSVFAPLGAELGAEKLVEVTERFGFNRPLPIPGAAESTIPPADEIGDDLAVGSHAIGQGHVQATALQMTLVAATIAQDGRMPLPTLLLGARPRFVRVTTPRIAREVSRMMAAVVADGTGTASQIDGVEVAGKTGTAELRSTVVVEGEEPADHLTDDIPDTDAWFVAYAPRRAPRVAVGVLFTEAGAGGDVAAPAAREVLVSALQRPQPGAG